jgi:hypothetical protein
MDPNKPIFPLSELKAKVAGITGLEVDDEACYYMSGVLEYLTADMLMITGALANESSEKQINPRHFTLAVRKDEELSQLLRQVCFPDQFYRSDDE